MGIFTAEINERTIAVFGNIERSDAIELAKELAVRSSEPGSLPREATGKETATWSAIMQQAVNDGRADEGEGYVVFLAPLAAFN